MPRPPDPKIKAALLEAAATSLAVDGIEGFNLRKVANEAATTTQSVYTYFGSKDQLIDAVVTEAFARLLAEQLRVAETDDVVDDLLRLSLAYRRYALQNPTFYRVMFGTNPRRFPDPSINTAPVQQMQLAAAEAFTVLLNHVGRVLASCGSVADAGQVAMGVWSLAHGIVSLELAGYLDPAIAESIYLDANRSLIAGIMRRGAEAITPG